MLRWTRWIAWRQFFQKKGRGEGIFSRIRRRSRELCRTRSPLPPSPKLRRDKKVAKGDPNSVFGEEDWSLKNTTRRAATEGIQRKDAKSLFEKWHFFTLWLGRSLALPPRPR